MYAQQDTKGSQDHPVISRYKGSLIDAYEVREYERYVLAVGKPTRNPAGKRVAEKTQELEGKVTRILYSTPGARSAFEIFRNYQIALQGAGFRVLYKCLPAECGGYYNFVVYTERKLPNVNPRNGNFDLPKDIHYLAAKAATSKGNVYVSLMVAMDNRPNIHPSTLLEVVETKEMDVGMVTVDADAIGKGIDAEGHMAIYGIYFDTGSAEIKQESASMLEEIAKLLKERPSLKLLVVGHTDSEGGYDYNIRLSMDRAESVVKSLMKQYEIDGNRMKAAGVGYLSPVASNDTPEGRTKNRRVELVKQ
jgi:outer membrane protein OmpA-like peptidoglycan-associated protein